MKDLYLTSYSVKGIKAIDKKVTLSFYKKTLFGELDTQKYNMKGIYGMNGSGKSGIISSVEILKSLILDMTYLNNSLVQDDLRELVNKTTGELHMEMEFLSNYGKLKLYHYEIELNRDSNGRFCIAYEELKEKKSASGEMKLVYCVKDGKIIEISEKADKKFCQFLIDKTVNLLSSASLVSLYIGKVLQLLPDENLNSEGDMAIGLCILYLLGDRVHVYLDNSDNHTKYHITSELMIHEGSKEASDILIKLLNSAEELNTDILKVISIETNMVPKTEYGKFEITISKLSCFLKIFKPELLGIDIDRKEDKDVYQCRLLMKYEFYSVDAEFESTGIKKLITLFAYLNEMNRGGIVFIDEMDSNLHDVYLCALLEYLMNYGKGQLCFTTHNVGPMDILQQNKKSIDFLSSDHEIISWTKCGNYSPANIYRSGMMEGSIFNIDSIDFIGVFDDGEDVE